MNLLSWFLFGLIAGGIAKFLMPGKDPGGCLITTILGIVGAVLGGAIGDRLGVGPVTGFNLESLGLAIAGSFILLLIFRLFIYQRRKDRSVR